MRVSLNSCLFFHILSHVLSGGALNCSKNSPRKGFCAIDSTRCCESYEGVECKKELSQNRTVFSPQLQFLPHSLAMDYRSNYSTLLCVRGFYVAEGMGYRGTETKGIHLSASFWNSETEKKSSHSATFVFLGTVSRTALKEAIICLEIDRTEAELAVPSNYVTVISVSLSPEPTGPVVVYMEESVGKFIPVCDIPLVDIFRTNCFKWHQREAKTESCTGRYETTTPAQNPEIPLETTELRKTPMTTTYVPIAGPGLKYPRAEESVWKYMIVILITAITTCLLSLIVARGVCAIKKQKFSEQPHNSKIYLKYTLNDEQLERLAATINFPANSWVPSQPDVREDHRSLSLEAFGRSLQNSISTTSMEHGANLTGASTPNLRNSFPNEFFKKHFDGQKTGVTLQKKGSETTNYEFGLSSIFVESTV